MEFILDAAFIDDGQTLDFFCKGVLFSGVGTPHGGGEHGHGSEVGVGAWSHNYGD